MIGSLVGRPLIHKDFQHKYPLVVSMYSQELHEVKTIFDCQLLRVQSSMGPLLNKNMPPVAGLLRWAQELRERITSGFERLKDLDVG